MQGACKMLPNKCEDLKKECKEENQRICEEYQKDVIREIIKEQDGSAWNFLLKKCKEYPDDQQDECKIKTYKELYVIKNTECAGIIDYFTKTINNFKKIAKAECEGESDLDKCAKENEHEDRYNNIKKEYEETKKKYKCNEDMLKKYEELKDKLPMRINSPEELMRDKCNTILNGAKSEIEECEAMNEKYLTLGKDGELHLKEVLRAFYPYLNQKVINKITNEEYHVKQFGVTIKNYDNGKDSTLTGRGNIDKDCIPIPENDKQAESYNLKSDAATKCGKHIFDDDTHIIISKARGHDETIDKDKPIVTVSLSQPLIVANHSSSIIIITKDYPGDWDIMLTLDDCKKFCDNNDCTSKGEKGNSSCGGVMWYFQGEIPVYMHDYSPEMV